MRFSIQCQILLCDWFHVVTPSNLPHSSLWQVDSRLPAGLFVTVALMSPKAVLFNSWQIKHSNVSWLSLDSHKLFPNWYVVFPVMFQRSNTATPDDMEKVVHIISCSYITQVSQLNTIKHKNTEIISLSIFVIPGSSKCFYFPRIKMVMLIVQWLCD